MRNDTVYNPDVYDGNFLNYLNQVSKTKYKEEMNVLQQFVLLNQEPKHKHLPGYDLYESAKALLVKKGLEFNSKNVTDIALEDLVAFEKERQHNM